MFIRINTVYGCLTPVNFLCQIPILGQFCEEGEFSLENRAAGLLDPPPPSESATVIYVVLLIIDYLVTFGVI